MKVNIKRDEIETGVLFKKTEHVVTFEVDLSEQEKEAIKELGMENYAWYQRTVQTPHQPWDLPDSPTEYTFQRTVQELLNCRSFQERFSNPMRANDWISDIKAALKNLKNSIESHSSVLDDESFEI